ncbi:MAG: type II CRISPR-associated endonuclease Cas1 [Clostridia bacterium]|nr:type II CRISPR-associated endonuclease Cas1 [Clostridia bacterium]
MFNYRQTENILFQTKWEKSICDLIWKQIIEQKIFMQISLLQFEGLDVPEELFDYVGNVEVGDVTNREGQVARVYFKALFGGGFVRHTPNEINACLNYGYSLILANISRKIVAMGYLTNIGIHHVGVDNPYNLACDLMEPFRPYIDRIVYENRELNLSSMKKILIESLYSEVEYNKKRMQFHNMLDMYVEDVIRQFRSGELTTYLMNYF